jgi:hypothetical protein
MNDWYLAFFLAGDEFAVSLAKGIDKPGTGELFVGRKRVIEPNNFRGQIGPLNNRGVVKEVFEQFK